MVIRFICGCFVPGVKSEGWQEDVYLVSKLDDQRRAGGRKRRTCFSLSFRVSHRRSSTGEASLRYGATSPSVLNKSLKRKQTTFSNSQMT